jgi:tetratricopeptide (TPR) repeat protein
MSARRRASVIVTAMVTTFAGSACAQSIRVADSLLKIGALARAESTYYAAARARPRDPLARWALGRFLVARGAPRVGATLFEEALQFGGEPSLIGADLAPVYLALGMYHELAAMPSPSLSAAERERARWLDAHPTRLVSPDSIVVLSYKPSPASRYLGRIAIRVNGRSVDAAIDPRVRGVVVSDTGVIARSLRHFDDADATSRAAWKFVVADSINIGGLAYRNVPIALQSLADKAQAIVGFDVLARLAPTFDPRTGRITARVSGMVASPVPNGDVFATLLTPSDFRVLQTRGWISASDAPVQRTLSERRWTFDARRGQLIVER